MFDLGVIYAQNIVLNNAEIFSDLSNKAVSEYKPVKEEEKRREKKSKRMNNGMRNGKSQKAEATIKIFTKLLMGDYLFISRQKKARFI